MQNISFQYKQAKTGYDMLTVKTDHGVTVEVLFDNNEPDVIYIDGTEHGALDDTLSGLFVCVKKDLIALSQVVFLAGLSYPDIMKEVKAEAAADAAHYQEVSNPYLSGRV